MPIHTKSAKVPRTALKPYQNGVLIMSGIIVGIIVGLIVTIAIVGYIRFLRTTVKRFVDSHAKLQDEIDGLRDEDIE